MEKTGRNWGYCRIVTTHSIAFRQYTRIENSSKHVASIIAFETISASLNFSFDNRKEMNKI